MRINVSVGRTDATGINSFISLKKINAYKIYRAAEAILTTGSARLMLTMAEKIATDKGYFAYCDTDSIFVKPVTAKDIQDFFRPLNPYSLPVEMFKIEEDDNHKPLDNVMFYGISAKRYCLYDKDNGNITIRKYSTHGLGL